MFINLKVTPLLWFNRTLFKRKSKFQILKLSFRREKITGFPIVFITQVDGWWLESQMNRLKPYGLLKTRIQLFSFHSKKFTKMSSLCWASTSQLFCMFIRFNPSRCSKKMEKTSNFKFSKDILRVVWLMLQYGMEKLIRIKFSTNGSCLKEWESRKWQRINLCLLQRCSPKLFFANGKSKMSSMLKSFQAITTCQKFTKRERLKSYRKWPSQSTRYSRSWRLKSDRSYQLTMKDAQNAEEKYKLTVITAK